MRPILLGPFGSMGILNMKLRIICIEDMILESILFVFALIRIATANTSYELWGAYASLVASTSLSLITSILVLDGGLQCFCCRSKPMLTSLRCFGQESFEYISDKALIKLFSIFSSIGILMAIITIITEGMTFWDRKESKRPVVDIPDHIDFGMVNYVERDNAIVLITMQIFITIPWRIYAIRISEGVLNAIHCVEVLQFRSAYSGDALRRLLPDTGLLFGVDLANERDLPALAKLYCESFSSLFEHIGLTKDCGPSIIESQWRSKGKLVLNRWLGRVGVIRNEVGEVIAALSLQLPGDAAAYESLMYRSCSDAYDVLNPLDTSSVSIVSNHPLDSSLHQFEEGSEEDDMHSAIPPEFYTLGLFGAIRFRYKHAIICDHVSPPGEAYVDFLCVGEPSRRAGVGSRLMRWAEQSAEKLGCGRIALSVWGLDMETQLFYEKLGYKLTDQRSDFLARFAVQLIFCSRSRFYDFEKPVGQEQGRAVYASDYGFTSDRVSELDAASRHGNHWTNAAAFGLSDFMNPSSVFVRRSRTGNSSGSGDGKPSSDLPALASTPDSSSLHSDSSLPGQPSNDGEVLVGSERRHHLQLTTLSRPADPLLINPHRERLFQRFQEDEEDSSAASDSLTPPYQLGAPVPAPPHAASSPPTGLFRVRPSPASVSATSVSVGNVLRDQRLEASARASQ